MQEDLGTWTLSSIASGTFVNSRTNQIDVYRSRWFKGAGGLPELVVYRSRWFTGAGGLQEPVVYRSRWFTGAGGLQEPVVYRSRWFTAAIFFTLHVISQ